MQTAYHTKGLQNPKRANTSFTTPKSAEASPLPKNGNPFGRITDFDSQVLLLQKETDILRVIHTQQKEKFKTTPKSKPTEKPKTSKDQAIAEYLNSKPLLNHQQSETSKSKKQNPLIPKYKIFQRTNSGSQKEFNDLKKASSFINKPKPSGLVKSILIPS